MGLTTKGSITSYWPDDDDNTMYIASSIGYSIQEIIDKCKEKWGDNCSLEDIEITSEKIHTNCIYYDAYDSGDYTDFIVITKN